MKKTLLASSIVMLLCCALLLPVACAAEEGYGYIDRKGNVVIDYQFDYAYSFYDGLACVFTGKLSSYGSWPLEGTYGFINTEGQYVIPSIYDEPSDFSDGYAVVHKNDQYGVIDTSGRTFIEFGVYNYISYSSKAKVFIVYNGSLTDWGFPAGGTYTVLNLDGQPLFSGNYSSLDAHGSCYVAQNADTVKYALLDSEGKPLTEFKYDKLMEYGDAEPICFRIGKRYGYLDAKGNEIIPLQYDQASEFVDGAALVCKGGKYCLIDTSGDVLAEYSMDYASYSRGKLATILAFEGTLEDGYPKNGRWYVMRTDGKYITKGFKERPMVSEVNGFCCVGDKDLNQKGVINLDGEVIIPFDTYDRISVYCGDVFAVSKKGLYALANTSGEFLTDFIWTDIQAGTGELLPARHQKQDGDFRGTRWGMSEEEFKAIAGSNPDYSGKLDGRDAQYIAYDGTPWSDEEYWDTTSHKSYYADMKGDALSYGYLTYETHYLTSRTDIIMTMSADNYDISFIVYYQSKTISAPKTDYSLDF